MNKNHQKNLFRQNLNINNKNMHENISTQQSNRTADIIKSSLPSTEGRDRILISHLPAVSQCASYLFSTWLTFQTPAQSFVIAQVIHYVCKEGKLEGWTGLNCSSQQRDGRLHKDGKKQNGENTKEKHDRGHNTNIAFAQRSVASVVTGWLRSCLHYMFFSAVSEFRSPALVCFPCSFWGIKEAAKQPQAWAKQSVDIFLAYHQDARRAASGVWHFGIQSGSCGAGTAELWNLQSAWDSHLRCTTGTRSLLLGSPGRRSMGWATKWMNIRGADQTVKTSYKLWKVETNPPPRLLLCKIHPHIWLKMILSCYGWFAGGASFQGSNTIYITVIHLMGVDYLNQASWVLLKWQILAFEKDLRRRSRMNNTDDFTQKVFQTWSSTQQYEAEHRVW